MEKLNQQKKEEFKKLKKNLQFNIEQINIKNNEHEQEIEEMKRK